MAVHTPRQVLPDGWGLPIGTGVGAGLGLIVGLLLGQIALGLSVGAALGLVVGATATTAHRTPADRRRVVLVSAILLGVDQLTKTVAQLAFDATDIAAWSACRDAGLDCVETLADIVVAPGVGLMYTVHPGLYWWPNHPWLIAGLHAIVLGVWVGVMAAAVWYRRRYRPSFAVDLAAGFFTVAAWGNLIDRLLVGGARDWLATPWWIANFADAAGWLVLPLLAVELWRHPPSRRLLRPGQLPLRRRSHTPAA